MTTQNNEHALTMLVQDLKEQFLENPKVNAFVDRVIAEYCKLMGFSLSGAHTAMEEELICQYQVSMYNIILARMIIGK